MRAGNATINTARLTRPERFDFVAVTDVPRRPRLRSTCERPEKKRKKLNTEKTATIIDFKTDRYRNLFLRVDATKNPIILCRQTKRKRVRRRRRRTVRSRVGNVISPAAGPGRAGGRVERFSSCPAAKNIYNTRKIVIRFIKRRGAVYD